MSEETKQLNIADVPTCLALLKTSFGDPDTTGTAGRELHQLRQGKRDLATYYVTFTNMIEKL